MSHSKLVDALGIEEEIAALRDLSGEETSEATTLLSAGGLPSEVPPPPDYAYERAQAEEIARTDLNFLAGLAMPEIFEYLFPPMYLAIWAWLLSFVGKSRTFPKLVLGIPRGFAKTTFVKLFVLYCILFTAKKFILIISSTEGHAKNIIADVIGFLEERNIVQVFGDYKFGKTIDKQEFKRFSFRGRVISIAGIGAEGSIRGLNVGNSRPDVMIFEDFQLKEDSENAELSKKLLERMTGTIMKAKDPKGCMYLYIGNMYNTPGCILKILKGSPHWLKFIVGGILSDGKSLWEELHPVKQLIEEYEADKAIGQDAVFCAEVLNDELAGLKSGIDVTAIAISPFTAFDVPQGRYIVIDPAGQKTTADKNCIGYFEVFDGSPVLRSVSQGNWSPLQVICNALIIALKTRSSCIFVENVAYQASLLFWFEHICRVHNLAGFQFLPLHPKGRSKNSRIRDMLKALVSKKGEFYLHPEVSPIFKKQAIDWNPAITKNVDDVLDVAAYGAQDVMPEYGPLVCQELELSIVNEARDEIAGYSPLPAAMTSPI